MSGHDRHRVLRQSGAREDARRLAADARHQRGKGRAGDLRRAEEHIDWFVSRAESYSLGPYRAVGRGFKGQLAIRRNDPRGGVESLQGSLAELRAARYEQVNALFNISLPDSRYPQPADRAALVESLLARAAAVPGVSSAGAIFGLPLTDFGYTISMSTLDGRRLSDDEQDARSLQVRVVTPAYFRAMAIPIVRGRAPSDVDRLGAPE